MSCSADSRAFVTANQKNRDTNQLPPYVVSVDQNESVNSLQLSLFERMLLSGVKDYKLFRQYRMSPGISEPVNQLFYNGTLEDDNSCRGRWQSKGFAELISNYHECQENDSFFVSVTGSCILQKAGSSSLVNQYYVSYIGHFLRNIFRKFPQLPRDVLVMSFYSLERHPLTELLAALNLRRAHVSSVDAAQGTENSFVVLSTTGPGRGTGLSLIMDTQGKSVLL